MRFLIIPVLWFLSLGRLDCADILCLGDSLTAGLGIPQGKAWPALTQQILAASASAQVSATTPGTVPWRFIDGGISGDTSAGGLRRIDRLLSATPGPVVVLIALGANDGLRGLPPAGISANLLGIIRKVRSKKAVPILMGMQLPTNYPQDDRAAFANVYSHLAASENVKLFPFLLDGVGGVRSMNLADGIHPNLAGHQEIAKRVSAWLYPYLLAQFPPKPTAP